MIKYVHLLETGICFMSLNSLLQPSLSTLANGKRLSDLMIQQIVLAAASLRNGSVVAFPTETVYGLGADISHSQAIRKVFAIKRRPVNHPLIVHFAEIAELEYWADEIPATAWLLAEHFWPGPLTLILPKSKYIPLSVTGGQDTVGLRIPRHSVALALLKELGNRKALAAPSANRFGQVSPTSAHHVRDEFGHEVDMVLDGGSCDVGLESTIVSCLDKTVIILRPGGIPVTSIEDLLKQKVFIRSNNSIRTPGSLAAHYAPATPLEIWPHGEPLWSRFLTLQQQGVRSAIMTRAVPPHSIRTTSENSRYVLMPSDPATYGKKLYATIRMLDCKDFGRLLVEAPPDDPEWSAITDRLQRASFSSS